MHHHKNAEPRAQTEQNEAVLGRRVVGIVDEQGMFIGEDRPGFLERDPVLALIGGLFAGVPNALPLSRRLDRSKSLGPRTRLE